jgi:acyl carrier protein
MDDKIKNIMAVVFEIPVELINDESSPDTIESWDSIKQMYLVTVIEEEFELEFSDDEIVEMMNMKLIKQIIDDKLASLSLDQINRG